MRFKKEKQFENKRDFKKNGSKNGVIDVWMIKEKERDKWRIHVISWEAKRILYYIFNLRRVHVSKVCD